ncbi:MAG TPA: DUF892 family protein, partial [Phycisphaerales bacterium]|nr:DUF892 family protein [Phycisphaerales bacterium]
MAGTSTLDAWLGDAHGVEQLLRRALENHARDAADLPELSARYAELARASARHAEMLASCLTRRGGSISTVKSVLGKATGVIQVAMSGLAADELVKDVLSDFAAVQYAVASYTALIEAARLEGDHDTAEV